MSTIPLTMRRAEAIPYEAEDRPNRMVKGSETVMGPVSAELMRERNREVLRSEIKSEPAMTNPSVTRYSASITRKIVNVDAPSARRTAKPAARSRARTRARLIEFTTAMSGRRRPIRARKRSRVGLPPR